MALSPDSKGIQLSVADEEFCCPLCCEVFNEPKLLPNCAHSFCKDCLRELALHSFNSSQVSCPVCRKISNLPRNGAEGLATNTLLVRLIDNIPGRKEREIIVKALKRCKEGIEKSMDVQNELEKKLSQIQNCKEEGLKLKREITEHAQSAIDSIKKWKQDCHKEVDSHLSQNCGLDFYGRLDEQRNKRRSHLDEARKCVKNAEEMLKRDQMSEILDMKDVMEAQLNEYASIPPCTLLQDIKQVQDFNMNFQKNEFQLDLGKLYTSVNNVQVNGTLLADVTVPSSGSGDMPSSMLEAINITGSHLQTNFESMPSPVPHAFSSSASSRPSDSIPASNNVPSTRMNTVVEEQIPLEFEPFRIAVCPQSGDIALLWEERRQVYLYNEELEYIGKIVIRYGDLWDVGFTIDDEVVVVNRAHNRLLLYEKNGSFVDFEVKIPRDDLKFTYVSVDDEGRLIVTSTKVNDDDDDEFIVPCIVVYNNDVANSTKMFGRRHLENPISRAVFLNGKFYVADECNGSTALKIFTSQGQHIKTYNISSWFCSLSTVLSPSNLIVMHTGYDNDDKRNFGFVENGHLIYQRSQQECPVDGFKQAIVLSGGPHQPVKQLEIYEGRKFFCRVRYHFT